MLNAYELACERAANRAAKVHNSFKDAGKNSIPSLEMNAITEGTTVTIPEGWKVYEDVIRGSAYTACKVVTAEGLDFYPSCLTRGAKPVDGSEYVRPSGSVVELAQKYGDMDKFFNEQLVGKPITFTKKTPVIAKAYDNPENTQTINVWQIDFAK